MDDRELLARLVSHDTVSGRPVAPLVEWLAEYLDRPGIRVEVQPGAAPGEANLIAVTGPEAGEEGAEAGLTLCGHLDVVPADPAAWAGDPFRLEHRAGELVGRGSCDMKGFVALAVNRVAQAAEAGGLRAPLGLLLTYDEETGSHGAKRFVNGYDGALALPRRVLVGEPTGLAAVRMHKGHLRIRIRVHGRSAHTGSPQLGVNAIERAGPVLAALRDLREELEREREPTSSFFGEVPFTVLAVSGIRGGEAVNVVPPLCELDVGVRPLPGEITEQLMERMRRAVGGEGVTVDLVGENPPLLTPEDASLHRLLLDLLGQEGSRGMPYASDGGWLAAAGYECVLCGPGRTDRMHRTDESISVEEMEAGGRLLDRLINRTCRRWGGE